MLKKCLVIGILLAVGTVLSVSDALAGPPGPGGVSVNDLSGVLLTTQSVSTYEATDLQTRRPNPGDSYMRIVTFIDQDGDGVKGAAEQVVNIKMTLKDYNKLSTTAQSLKIGTIIAIPSSGPQPKGALVPGAPRPTSRVKQDRNGNVVVRRLSVITVTHVH